MKVKELREKSNEELISIEKDLRLVYMRTAKNNRKAVRKAIARVLTILGERGIKIG